MSLPNMSRQSRALKLIWNVTSGLTRVLAGSTSWSGAGLGPSLYETISP